MHALNHVVIIPKPFAFDILPAVPEVRAGFEPLLVTVDWSQNRGFWNRAEVHSLLDPSGKPCAVFPDRLQVLLGDDTEATVMFNSTVPVRVACKYSVTLHRVYPVESFTFDPGVILKPGP